MSGAAAMFLRRASKFFHSPVPFKSPDGHAFTLSRAKLQLFSSVGGANPEQDVASAAGQEKVGVVKAVGDKSAPTLHPADAPPVLNVVIPVVAVLEAPKAELLMDEPPKPDAPDAAGVQSLGKEPPVAASSAGEPAVSVKKSGGRKQNSKYTYGTIRVVPDEPLFKQPKVAETMRKLGLEAFLNAKIPKVNRELCDEFLSTYQESGGQGVVQGRDIVITPEAIHNLTGLPLGIKPVGRLSRQESVAVKSFATWRHADMYCLQSLKLGDESEAVSAAGRLLMQKMRMRRHGSGTVAAQILLRLQESLQSNVQPQWAAYMADRMRRAARLTHTKDRCFYFGGWLSGLIQSALALPEDQVKKAAAAAAATAEKNGKEEVKKKKPVRSRAKGVKEKGEEKAEKKAVVIEV